MILMELSSTSVSALFLLAIAAMNIVIFLSVYRTFRRVRAGETYVEEELDLLVLPVLFAAGMSLVDTTDGVMMLGAYDWAFVKPMRKLYYNMTITMVSIVVAILIGGIEALGLLREKLGFTGEFWNVVGALNGNFNNLGFAIIGVFLAALIASYAIYRAARLDDVEVQSN